MRSNFNSLSAFSNIIFVSFAGRINTICARLCSFGLVACAVFAKANALFRCGVRRSRAITPLAPVYPGLCSCSVCAAASIKRVGEYLILRAVSRPRSFVVFCFAFVLPFLWLQTQTQLSSVLPFLWLQTQTAAFFCLPFLWLQTQTRLSFALPLFLRCRFAAASVAVASFVAPDLQVQKANAASLI